MMMLSPIVKREGGGPEAEEAGGGGPGSSAAGSDKCACAIQRIDAVVPLGMPPTSPEEHGVVALASNPSSAPPATPSADASTHGSLLPRSGSAICCTLVADQSADLLMRPLRTSRRVVYSIMGRGESGRGRAELTVIGDGEPQSPQPSGGQAELDRQSSRKRRTADRRMGYEALTTALSALYAKLLVVLGVALPVTEVISTQVPAGFYHGFYLYLYSGSLLFVFLMHASLLRQRAVFSIVRAYHKSGERTLRKPSTPVQRYCSFYLRVGAIGFGIGSMIYSGLEFGQFFELRKEQKCHKILHAVTPVTRMLLTLLQMQFIFLNNKLVDMRRHKMFARFGLMHMIAMNMCEWLYVIVEETKHEIVHLSYHPPLEESSNSTTRTVADLFECRRTNIMGSLVQNASPFLFPCTIEYSLICAVILYAMWKDVSRYGPPQDSPASRAVPSTVAAAKAHRQPTSRRPSGIFGNMVLRRSSMGHLHGTHHSAELFSVDCANAHRGLFAGILVLVLTFISLITFFVLVHAPGFEAVAVFEVTVCEMVLYVLTTIAVIVCTVQMRDLRYRGPQRKLGMDNALLVTAQTGMYVYCMFAIVGAYFAREEESPPGEEPRMTEDAKAGGVAAELCSLVQTTCQTIFVLDAWCRRCRTEEQCRRKPGRQLVTFLLVANMAMWTINTLEKNRAEFHPTHLHFYGVWAWTIITHVSMPLAIFYRFHSTVCLYEIWKTAYKMKPEPKSQVHR
ncbi:proton channel OtopLc-like [Hetaerina americana]|uniref:proton channel OtopLc-like n=1 Tax=Hetaerina americana TaxID=62018 RepID=UPI003A7F3FD0